MGNVVNIPDEYRGTYKGAGYFAKYLKAMGFTTIELLPVHETDNDANPDDSAAICSIFRVTFDAAKLLGILRPCALEKSFSKYAGQTTSIPSCFLISHFFQVLYTHSSFGVLFIFRF